MADSNLTKYAFARALRELMEKQPFGKIGIADICCKCGMNRTSFYYHFKDKYELIYWIFDTEVIPLMLTLPPSANPSERLWGYISSICGYFYQNRLFYRKALRIEGQNSLKDHFREVLQPFLHELICSKERAGNKEASAVFVNFYTDAFLDAILRWLQEEECMPAEDFVDAIKSCIRHTALLVDEYTQNSP